MEKIVLCSLFVTVFIKGSHAFLDQRFWKLRTQVEVARAKQAERYVTLLHKSHAASPVKTYYLEQPLDYFDAMSKEWGKTYKQRYCVNPEYWFSPTSPVFLFIGGEGTLSSRDVEVVTNAVVMHLLPNNGLSAYLQTAADRLWAPPISRPLFVFKA